jgi:hypothetical protein
LRYLISVIIFLSGLSAEVILRDELSIHQEFHNSVEKMGAELFQKSGISTHILILKTTNGKHLNILGEEELAKLLETEKSSLILTFAETEQKVDIVASKELLELFDKEQILSPYPWTGTILPILGETIKQDPRHKYSVALFNGYADIIEQIAKNKNIVLENSVGDSNKYVLNIIRIIFYSIIIIALAYLLRKSFNKRKNI